MFILARGKRKEVLTEFGLVIEHTTQKKTTIDRINIVDELGPEDAYDAVFVVLQRTQVDEVIPILAANTQCRLFILTGNNGEAEKTHAEFMRLSSTKPTVLFGFLGCGGQYENGRFLSYHKDEPAFVIGDLQGGTAYREVFDALFEGTVIKPWHSAHIDAWLKYHLALILPMVYAIHSVKGDMKKFSRSGRLIRLALSAIREAMASLEQLGFGPEPPELVAKFQKPAWLWVLMLRLIVRTKSFRLAAVNHGMSALAEMNFLSGEFHKTLDGSDIPTPALDELSAFLIKVKAS